VLLIIYLPARGGRPTRTDTDNRKHGYQFRSISTQTDLTLPTVKPTQMVLNIYSTTQKNVVFMLAHIGTSGFAFQNKNPSRGKTKRANHAAQYNDIEK